MTKKWGVIQGKLDLLQVSGELERVIRVVKIVGVLLYMVILKAFDLLQSRDI